MPGNSRCSTTTPWPTDTEIDGFVAQFATARVHVFADCDGLVVDLP
jgi:hypothetical protein